MYNIHQSIYLNHTHICIYISIYLLGMNDLSAGIYTPEVGWVGPSDPREPYGEMQRVIDEIMEDMQKKRDVYLGDDSDAHDDE